MKPRREALEPSKCLSHRDMITSGLIWFSSNACESVKEEGVTLLRHRSRENILRVWPLEESLERGGCGISPHVKVKAGKGLLREQNWVQWSVLAIFPNSILSGKIPQCPVFHLDLVGYVKKCRLSYYTLECHSVVPADSGTMFPISTIWPPAVLLSNAS